MGLERDLSLKVTAGQNSKREKNRLARKVGSGKNVSTKKGATVKLQGAVNMQIEDTPNPSKSLPDPRPRHKKEKRELIAKLGEMREKRAETGKSLEERIQRKGYLADSCSI